MQVTGVVDANNGSLQITVLATLISDSKKRFCFRQTWRLSGPQDLFPCLSLHRQRCLKEADWEKNKGVCSAKEPLCTEHKEPAEIPEVSQVCQPRLATKYGKVEESIHFKSGQNRAAIPSS